ncbi:MAG TPA: carbohydrate-binding family 9-like protein [Candidatus Aminicenantes bacterium]|nr:carbohydrate-binding family 9-like protein [Candidatus Aminicenantes bacterium]
MRPRYGCDERELAHYTCYRASHKMVVDGRLDKPAWKEAPRSPRFVDLVSGVPGFLDTRVAALWDDDGLYVAFWASEPNVQARLTGRDSLVWTENDVEVFIGGEDCYYEFEINARGTVYEVFYIWQDALKKGGRFDVPEFDLRTRRVDVLGGFQDGMRYGKHPRGARWAFMDWDMPGLRTAVRVQGTLNDASDIDEGWTVEIAFPWRGMKPLAGKRPIPPRDGDVWRLDFSRFELVESCGVTVEPHPGWALNRHGVYDSHIPECFSFVHFSGLRAGETPSIPRARPGKRGGRLR